jgi:CRISPR-associated protein Cas2
MASNKTWYLVAYDIRDPKRLAKVAKCLKGYGSRLQFSVFRCRLNDRERERLAWELKKITKSEDNLLITGLCDRCIDRIRSVNKDIDWPEELPGYEIVG